MLIAALSFSLLFAQKSKTDSLREVEAAKTEVWAPEPPVITPGNSPQGAPADAIILFDGKNLDQWRSEKDSMMAAGWDVFNGIMTVNKKNAGIVTKKRFTDYQVHLEWRVPENITGKGQGRGNSGIFLANTGAGDEGYEIQILDNYNNKTYVNGQAGSVYKQTIPLANACKKPGEWQTYDIIWTAPRFNEDGSLKTAAYVTVVHNGVLLQNHTEIKGETVWIGKPFYKAHGPSPIKLQAHGDPSEPLSFRNIWLRPL
ncbi:MAG: DUF1080 domain-containing protein [Chitinophagaceae bacterium]|nr:DUF1080 domain-containing protein [Chitinophagaceae bacterium]